MPRLPAMRSLSLMEGQGKPDRGLAFSRSGDRNGAPFGGGAARAFFVKDPMMQARLITTACAAFILVAAAGPTSAQTAPEPGASGSEKAAGERKPAAGEPKKAEGAPKREPSAGQLAAQERQRKCSAEWKDAKAAGKVSAETKWPKFYSACNARLKDGKA